jgi:cell division protein FtsB
MRGKRESKTSQGLRKIWVAAVALFFFVLLIASFFGEQGRIELYRAQRNKEALMQQIADLEKIKKDLEREIEELQKNPWAVDEKAREKLWLMKPDEVVIIKNKN